MRFASQAGHEQAVQPPGYGRTIGYGVQRGENAESAVELAELAKGSLRSKRPQLRLALEGRVHKYQRLLLGLVLERIEYLERLIPFYVCLLYSSGMSRRICLTPHLEGLDRSNGGAPPRIAAK
jgi:hypothetical protein